MRSQAGERIDHRIVLQERAHPINGITRRVRLAQRERHPPEQRASIVGRHWLLATLGGAALNLLVDLVHGDASTAKELVWQRRPAQRLEELGAERSTLRGRCVVGPERRLRLGCWPVRGLATRRCSMHIRSLRVRSLCGRRGCRREVAQCCGGYHRQLPRRVLRPPRNVEVAAQDDGPTCSPHFLHPRAQRAQETQLVRELRAVWVVARRVSVDVEDGEGTVVCEHAAALRIERRVLEALRVRAGRQAFA
mmetsp:Transcript_13818/g.36232  ORF Transcript_13818/g.36232 Transcript_13818/m.36232 type:complete len:250 (-) Transcript_13818:266-1015(-)